MDSEGLVILAAVVLGVDLPAAHVDPLHRLHDVPAGDANAEVLPLAAWELQPQMHVQGETTILVRLDEMLKTIPARKRRKLMSELLSQTLGLDVGDAERVRQRLKDYRLKPGRSPRGQPSR